MADLPSAGRPRASRVDEGGMKADPEIVFIPIGNDKDAGLMMYRNPEIGVMSLWTMKRDASQVDTWNVTISHHGASAEEFSPRTLTLRISGGYSDWVKTLARLRLIISVQDRGLLIDKAETLVCEINAQKTEVKVTAGDDTEA